MSNFWPIQSIFWGKDSANHVCNHSIIRFLLLFLSSSYIPSCSSPFLSPPTTMVPTFSFTRRCLLPLPVSPVYEGKFIGLPGAVSWRWPPLLKPQQGFTLRTEQKQQSGHTALFPSPHIHTRWYTHTSHYQLMSILVFLMLSPLNTALLHHFLHDCLGVFFFFSDFILLHLAFVFYWSTRSSYSVVGSTF